jgi:signal transduction histidine kinase
VVLQVVASPDTPVVSADADRIEQVLLNLLDNAIKFSHPGGSVAVRLGAAPDGAALVEVRDEGIGIPAADMPRVGQRFFKADKSRSCSQGGSGLGLAIARVLVQAHSGELSLDSQEGVGTTARFVLPSL